MYVDVRCKYVRGRLEQVQLASLNKCSLHHAAKLPDSSHATSHATHKSSIYDVLSIHHNSSTHNKTSTHRKSSTHHKPSIHHDSSIHHKSSNPLSASDPLITSPPLISRGTFHLKSSASKKDLMRTSTKNSTTHAKIDKLRNFEL